MQIRMTQARGPYLDQCPAGYGNGSVHLFEAEGVGVGQDSCCVHASLPQFDASAAGDRSCTISTTIESVQTKNPHQRAALISPIAPVSAPLAMVGTLNAP